MVAKEFLENVQSGDVMTVRSALVDYLIIDRSFRTFDEALSYASSQLPVIEDHDGKEFEPKAAWDMRYLNLQKAALSFNFSRARIDHLKDVIKAVMPAEASNATVTAPTAHVSAIERGSGGRTGRKVIGETLHQASQSTVRQESSHYERRVSSSGRTGKKVVSETEHTTDDQPGQKNIQGIDGASALIVGGVAIATVGVVAVEPVVIGAGVAIAGAGCVVKVSRRK